MKHDAQTQRPKKDYAIFIQHAQYEPYLSIAANGPLKTWLSNPPENVFYFFARTQSRFIWKLDLAFHNTKWKSRYGRIAMFVEAFIHIFLRKFRPGNSLTFLPGTQIKAIQINMPDINLLYAHKTISFLEASLSYNWKYLVSVTSTSYVNLDALENCLVDLPNEKCVAGKIIYQGENVFPSGTFRVFSRDVVENLIRNRKKYRLYLPEDLALGRLIIEMGITPIELASLNVPDLSTLRKYSKNDLSKIPHFRCKSGTYENRNDVVIINELHEILGK